MLCIAALLSIVSKVRWCCQVGDICLLVRWWEVCESVCVIILLFIVVSLNGGVCESWWRPSAPIILLIPASNYMKLLIETSNRMTILEWTQYFEKFTDRNQWFKWIYWVETVICTIYWSKPRIEWDYWPEPVNFMKLLIVASNSRNFTDWSQEIEWNCWLEPRILAEWFRE